MKMYRLFLYNKEEDLDPSLYAITNDDNLYKGFLAQRNPDLFFSDKIEITKKDWAVIEYKLHDYLLYISNFKTKGDNHTTVNVRLIITHREENDVYIATDRIFVSMYSDMRDEVYLFNDDIKVALHNYGYFYIKDLGTSIISEEEYSIDNISWSLMSRFAEKLHKLPYQIDKVAIFIRLVGNTLRED